ncbi:thiamine pyrophosphate-binding protein [Microtetraspora fusca]|uniref:thiamine pyrophosphate-binding protein n=1 Tax=Microtetraspora fusca TaxID=1997 RepID=UPI000833E8B8|nr:thiamine pyrophosphate-binding protein [Microtetraspora fusca]
MEATGAEVLVAALRTHGVDTVFGIPGTHNLAVYEELARGGVSCVTPRHEQGAGYAADGYARVTGRPGVALTTTGPGAVNAATALAQAYSDSSPVLLLSPGVPSDHPYLGRGYLHESKDQSGALGALCAWSHRVTSIREIPAAVGRAFTSFAEGRPRPVHVEVPADLLERRGSADLAVPYRPMPRVPDPAALDRAAGLLRGARRPAIVLGGGAQRPGDDEQVTGRLAMLLAERIGARVVTTVNGKGSVPESHHLCLGATLRLPVVRRWLASCDVVLAVGTELAPADLWEDRFVLTGRLIRVDVDPAQMYGDHVADVPVLADACLALEGLAARVPETKDAPMPDGRVERERDAELREVARRWAPQLAALREAMPADTVVVGDNSMMSYHGAIVGMPVDPPGRFLFPAGYGTLGFALPAAIGAKVGRPDRPVVVLAGDGALQFSVQELATAVELRLSLPIVVAVNGGFGQIRDEMRRRGIPPVGVDLHAPDLMTLAAAYGACGRVADRPEELGDAVAEALKTPLPTVISFREPG